MNSSRLWTVGAVGAVLAIGAGAGVLGVQPALAAATAADSSTAQVDSTNATSQRQLEQLAKAAATQSTLTTLEARLGRANTGSLRLNTFSRQLRDAAATDGVDITAISMGEAKDYEAPVAPAAPAGASPSGAAAATPTPTPTAAPTPPTPAEAAAAAKAAAAAARAAGLFGTTDPLITGANFTVVPVTVSVTGSEAAGVSFAQDVQQMQRLFAVDTITYTKGTSAGDPPSTTISGNIYALTD